MIRSAAVLGAGTMGAQIAAHLANAGLPVLLFDVDRARATAGLQRVATQAPGPFFTPDAAARITLGGLDEGLDGLATVDWIIEAVVERLAVKRELLARVDATRRNGAIVSTNTSAIPIATLADGRSHDFRRHWLGTHFFNPPRYLPLLELIPGPDTLTSVTQAVQSFADRRLGKNVVMAGDAPGFIANRLAVHGALPLLACVADGGWTIEEVDAITGPALGRPRSATFRTLDLAGLDVFAEVAGRDGLPPYVHAMLDRGWLGEKSGQGFYKRARLANGDTGILTLDPRTLEYRQRQPPDLPAVDAAAALADPRERVRALFDDAGRVGRLVRDAILPTLEFALQMTPAVARSVDDVDRVMRWGFGWELGPVEILEAIGRDTGQRARRWLPPAGPDFEVVRAARARGAVVRGHADASLLDLGDGVLCLEFHSKMNVLGDATIRLLHDSVRDAANGYQALVIGNEGPHFSAGANLARLLAEAEQGNWEGIAAMVAAFQQAVMAIKYSAVPVVVAPAGLSLGGACEMALHADRVQAAAESYLGLVETGVGLIPAGGGTKEMVVRAAAQRPAPGGDLTPEVQRAFESIAFARTSTSAADARRLGYLRPVDSVTMNRARLIAEAKACALRRVDEGYQPPLPAPVPVGGDAVASVLALGVHLAWRGGRISDHDAQIARRLATVMAGGSWPHPTSVTEQHLLDLEREAFLALLGETKTRARIAHTLKSGKPLRN